jgi:glycosyltransferase involved in cell wall biosynthesis
MKNSVIVCTKNRTNALAKLIRSLCLQTLLPDELIIIDASQNDKTYKMLKESKYNEYFNIIYKKSEASLTKQRNIGVDLVKGEYLFFFDDDVVLKENFIKVICDTFYNFESNGVGGVMGRIINISSSTKIWDQLFKRIFFLSDVGKGRVKISGLPSIRIDNHISFVESLSGGCTAYRKKVLEDYRFDENLKGYAYLEDVDFSFRVGKKYRLVYQPKAKLSHFPSTYLTADRRALKKQLVQHQIYLFRKNMPNNFQHYSGLWVSLIGNLIYNGIIQRDSRACLGIIEGLLNPLR